MVLTQSLQANNALWQKKKNHNALWQQLVLLFFTNILCGRWCYLQFIDEEIFVNVIIQTFIMYLASKSYSLTSTL